MYDVIIIGAGSAGLSAAVYSRRFLMKTLVIGQLMGGLLTTTHTIENWPGEKSILGRELMKKIEEHARSIGAEIINDQVTELKKTNKGFKVTTTEKSYETKSVILATGTIHRHLGVPGEGEYSGRGVSYCAACDGMFFKNKTIAVVGGSDSAVKEALMLTEYAKKVYIIYRKEKLRAEPVSIERLNKKIKEGIIEVIYNANVTKIKGDGKKINSLSLDTNKELPIEGLFVDIGLIPQNELAKNLGVKLNDKEEIITDKQSKTNIPGVLGAGDCTDSKVKQAITGAAQGVIAAFSAYEYVNS